MTLTQRQKEQSLDTLMSGQDGAPAGQSMIKIEPKDSQKLHVSMNELTTSLDIDKDVHFVGGRTTITYTTKFQQLCCSMQNKAQYLPLSCFASSRICSLKVGAVRKIILSSLS
jgi:hypothetical protein